MAQRSAVLAEIEDTIKSEKESAQKKNLEDLLNALKDPIRLLSIVAVTADGPMETLGRIEWFIAPPLKSLLDIEGQKSLTPFRYMSTTTDTTQLEPVTPEASSKNPEEIVKVGLMAYIQWWWMNEWDEALKKKIKTSPDTKAALSVIIDCIPDVKSAATELVKKVRSLNNKGSSGEFVGREQDS